VTEKLEINRSKAAVIIMDYQIRILDSLPKERLPELLKRANIVLAKARQKGVPVIYVEVIRGERTPETEIHPDIKPKAGETVLTKRRVGPFSTTNLDEILTKQGINTLVLLGVSTSGCVLSTVRWGYDIDYQLIVISDCCADRDDEVQRVLMEKIFTRMTKVITSQEFIEALGSI
jgi:nicotinamidase-related amidase